MRDIKFRAWDKTGKCMVDWGTMRQTAFNGNDMCLMYDILCGCRYDMEVMQYTGLKDKNGIEIYEDYVLSATVVDNKYNHHNVIGKVIFNEFEYCLETDLYHWPLISWKCVESCEIIGNIHENPELVDE